VQPTLVFAPPPVPLAAIAASAERTLQVGRSRGAPPALALKAEAQVPQTSLPSPGHAQPVRAEGMAVPTENSLLTELLEFKQPSL